MESTGGNLTVNELKIENLVVELAKRLDKQYFVKDEFYIVLNNAINRHIELIGEA